MRTITINGRIAANVSRQVSKQGNSFISFSIANNEFGDAKNDEGNYIPQWYRVTSFLPQHVNLAQYLTKGKPIIVTGKYSNSLYKNNNGHYSISNDIIASDIFFEIGSERQNEQTSTNDDTHAETKNPVDDIPKAASRTFTQPKVSSQPSVNNDDDDDLPF